MKTRKICATCIDAEVDVDFKRGYCYKKHLNLNNLESSCPDWERTSDYFLKKREKLGIPLKVAKK